MTLADSYFVYGGYGYRFKVYSDRPTRTVLHNVIREPISGSMMEVYQVIPKPEAQWVIVMEMRGWQTQVPQSRYYRVGEQGFEEVSGEDAAWVRSQRHEHQKRRAA